MAKKKMAGGGMMAKKKMAGGGMAGKKKQAMKAKIKMARAIKPSGRLNMDDLKRASKAINKRAKGK